MYKKKILTIIVILLIFIIFIFLKTYNLNTNSNRISNDTYVSYGFLNSTGDIISNGSHISIDIAKPQLQHTLDLDQSLDENYSYLLMVLVDFNQVKFKVENEVYSYYEFDVNKKDSIQIDLKIDIPKNAKELDYILIRKPNYMPAKENIEELISLQTVLPIRFKLNDLDYNLNYETSLESFYDGQIDNIGISDKKNKFDLLYQSNDNSNIYITVGNYSSDDIDYAVVLFNDWEQIKFDDGQLSKVFKLKPDEKQSIQLGLPNVDKDSVFQAIAFPLPYKVSLDNMFSTNAFGSPRLLVKDSE
ncbi:MAG: hypothetical protein ACRCXT_20670 [Paraclostridium sp.]